MFRDFMVRVQLFSDAFCTEAGEIIIDNERVKAQFGEEKVDVPLTYLAEVSLLDRVALGKIKARVVIYDVIGNKHVFEALVREPDFHMLHGFLKKEK